METKILAEAPMPCTKQSTSSGSKNMALSILLLSTVLACIEISSSLRSFATSRVTGEHAQPSTAEVNVCPALLPNFASNPPDPAHPAIRNAMRKTKADLDARFRANDLDSIALAVVTSKGSIYEEFWGTLRAKGTNVSSSPPPDRNSIYRLASVSKLATAMETLILRDRGLLALDNAVEKVFPNLTYNHNDGPITFRALMSHMSGLGRDWPPGDASKSWATSLEGAGPPPANGQPFPSTEAFLRSIEVNPLVVAPFSYPVYSNAGFALLGLANVAVNKQVEEDSAPSTHAELVKRDIFDPLGLDGSAFLLDDVLKERAAIPAKFSEIIDDDFTDSMNPSGGQMSSLSDLVKIVRTLIDPSQEGSLLRPYTVREWFRPLHSFFDDLTEVGLLWEIEKLKDSHGRTHRLFTKVGMLPGYHSLVAVHPTKSYGVVILSTSVDSHVAEINDIILKHFAPAFERAHEETAQRIYAGSWASTEANARVTIQLMEGTLYLTEYVQNGTDVMVVLRGSGNRDKHSLWDTGHGHFRIAAMPWPMAFRDCVSTWVSLDAFGYANKTAVNTIEFVMQKGEMALKIPASNLALKRVG